MRANAVSLLDLRLIEGKTVGGTDQSRSRASRILTRVVTPAVPSISISSPWADPIDLLFKE